LYSPVTGTVIQRNEELSDAPEVVNDSAYEQGWMIKVEVTDTSNLDELMSAEEYEQFLESQ